MKAANVTVGYVWMGMQIADLSGCARWSTAMRWALDDWTLYATGNTLLVQCRAVITWCVLASPS